MTFSSIVVAAASSYRWFVARYADPKGLLRLTVACAFLVRPQLAISFLFKFNRFDQFYSSACPFNVPSVVFIRRTVDDSGSYQRCTVNRFCRLKTTNRQSEREREKRQQNDVINFMGKHTSFVIYSNPLQFNPIRCVRPPLVCVHKQCHPIVLLSFFHIFVCRRRGFSIY